MILLILLWGVFASLKDAVLVLLTLPLATVGGVLALHLSGLPVPLPMDLLTIIGFVILLGLVVNNAILLVHQTRTAGGGDEPPIGGGRCPAKPDAAHRHDQPHQHLRHAAADAEPE